MRGPAAIVAVLALAGCGSSGTPPGEQARGTLESFLEACALEKPADAVRLLNEPMKRSFLEAGSGTEGCTQAIPLRPEPEVDVEPLAQSFSDAAISRLELRAESATATVVAPDGRRAQVELESLGQDWYLAGPPGPG